MARNKENLGPVFGQGLRKISGKDLGDVLEKEITDEMFKDDGTRKRRCKSSKINRKSLRRSTQFSSAMIIIPDWTSLDQYSPFYKPAGQKDNNGNYIDPNGDKYHITIPTAYETLGSQKDKIFNEARTTAVKSLIEVYNKSATPQTVKQLTQASEAIDYFIPARPNPRCGPNGETIPLFGVKVLVTVPAALIDSLPLVATNSLAHSVPLADREINLITSEVRKKIKTTSNTLRAYQKEAENSGNIIRGMSLDQEADRLEAFMFVLENLLSANGILLRDDKDDLIIIGTTEDYKILYVLFDDGERFLRLEAGYSSFIKSKSASHDRTVKLLADMGKIEGVGHPKFPVTDFVRNFQSQGGEFGISFDKDIFDVGVKRAQNDQSLFSKDAVRDLESFIKTSNSRPAKTEYEKQEEDRYLLSAKLVDSHASSNGRFGSVKSDFVADVTLSAPSMKRVKEKLKSLEDLYQGFFHRVNLCRILQIAIDCLKIADRACRIGKAALINATCEDFLEFFSGSLVMRIVNIPELERVVRGRIMDCLGRIDAEQRDFLLERIQFKSGTPIKHLGDLSNIPLDSILDGLGSRGKKFLHDICSDPLARKQIVDVIPDEICSELNSELSDIVKKCEFPTITLPDFFPTIDIMANITTSIEIAITDAILVALIELIKSMIEQILNCENGFKVPDFGALNWGDLLAKTFDVNVNSDSYVSLQTNMMGGIAVRAGLLGTEALTGALIGLVDDVSALASPSELANLLNGDADEDIIKLLRCLLENKYQELALHFDSDAKIDDFFKMLGDALDKGPLLQQIGQLNAPAVIRFDSVCEVPSDDNFRRMLENKGLTKEEIDKQVADAKKRKEEMFDGLVNNLLKGNPLSDALPPIFCKKDANGNSTGLVERDHPSFTFMLDKTIDVIYDGVHMSFNNEISNFVNALKEVTTIPLPRAVPRRINMSVETEDGGKEDTEVENPEFRRLISQGVTVEDPEDDGDPVLVFEDLQFTTGFAANGLKKNLETLNTDSRLFDVNPQTGKISLVIPNAIDSGAISDKVLNAFGRVKDPTIAALLSKFQQSQTNKNTTKKVAINYEFLPASSETKDKYKISIDDPNSPLPDTNEIETDIPREILGFIKDKSLAKDTQESTTIPGTSFKIASSTAPLPQVYFGSYVANVCKSGGSIYRNGSLKSNMVSTPYVRGISSQKTNNQIDSILRDKFKTEVHQNLFVDLFGMLSKQVAKSPLFDLKMFSLLDFTPNVVPGQCAPHLLDLESIKKKMKKAIEDSACEEDLFPTTDGLGKAVPNSMEREGINGAIRTFIRLIVIENVLKSIFVFSEFRINKVSDLDPTMRDFIAKAVIEQLRRTGEITKDAEFQNQFYKELMFSYNLSLTQDAANASTEEEKISIENKRTTNPEVAAEYYVNIELDSVISRICDLMIRKDSSNQVDLDAIFLTQHIPLYDVQSDGESSRFASEQKKVFDTRNFKNTTDGRSGIEQTEAINVTTAKGFVPNARPTVSFGNGNFILERYVRVSYKNEKNRLAKKVAQSQSEALAGKRAKTHPQSFRGGIAQVHLSPAEQAKVTLTEEEKKASIDYVIRTQFGVLSLKDFDLLMKNVIAPEMAAWQDPKWAGIDVGTGPLTASDANKAINEIFETISYGLRLVYVPPLGEKEKFTDHSSGINGIMNTIVSNADSTDPIIFDKSFKITEKKTVVKNKIKINPLTGKRTTTNIEEETLSRDVFQFPLVSVEVSADLQEIAASASAPNVLSKWNDRSEELLNNLRTTREYEFLFHYCMPIDKMFALLLIYNITYFSGMEKVSKLFDGTKIAIKSVFQALLNSGNYRYEDQYVNDQLGGNIGLNTNGLNNADTNPEVPGTSVAAMAIRTPFLILKGLVELTDGNIAIARKIVDVAKAAGKNVPILAASLGQLPMNVFPPPPIGPGIGIPITPLGFVYLGLNIDEIFDAAKETKRDNAFNDPSVSIDFRNKNKTCPDE